uniref:RB_B domain-containing protein n=1 Tax=Steinernema glaseri TaxID=37863 RepID=A0A1I8A5H4_9BILA
MGMGGKRRMEFEDEDLLMAGPPKRMAMDPNTEWHFQNSSTVVFFRKVYYLAAIRLSDLFDRIRIDEKCRQRVWTLFEHILRTDTTLMAGRHLDQNLMCCIYIVAKICKLDISFHDIMYHYRHQPQACSRVYRKVLLEKPKSPNAEFLAEDGASRDSIGSIGDGKLRSGSTLPVPGMSSSPATPEPSPEYTDLIQYYNSVFVGRTETFVKRLQPSGDGRESQVGLLSMPALKAPGMSPRKSVNVHLNVHAMSAMGRGASGFRFQFNINKSPSKDLKTINTVVRAADRTPYTLGGGGAYRSIHQSRMY